MKHFVTRTKNYLVQEGTLQSEQPSRIPNKVTDIKRIRNNMRAKSEQTPLIPTNEVSRTNTAVDDVDVANSLYNKFNKFMPRLRVAKHKIPIAILSTVLGIVGIGTTYYATSSTDGALDTIGSDTDTEVLNDTNDMTQRHGVCIATITACTALLALCTITAYWIVCK